MPELLIPAIAVVMVVLLTFFIPNTVVKVLLVVGFISYVVFAGFNAADTQQKFVNDTTSYIGELDSVKTITDGLK
ncbi:hypothetical protein [Microbacterium sp. p3-SID336]|uniref:hypothetical protein n=1 Tax=Microbacterium sp. p3-SID336 TaxID=2916212 RepID=UPI0021A83448|nr:hypothetical protein [Microbacterium sp. p3-SID336]MCT1478301.1 hypothetical protein [Microbacterium sp. p3-SID336]